MGYLFRIISVLFFVSIAFAEDNLATLAQKSAGIRAKFEKCGFCSEKRKELESFHEDHLLPALEKYGKSIQKKPDSAISKLIIDLAIANKDSAAEGFSFALGDAYLSDPKEFNQLVGKLKLQRDKEFIYDMTNWGIQNHTDLSKDKTDKIQKDLISSKAKILRN